MSARTYTFPTREHRNAFMNLVANHWSGLSLENFHPNLAKATGRLHVTQAFGSAYANYEMNELGVSFEMTFITLHLNADKVVDRLDEFARWQSGHASN